MNYRTRQREAVERVLREAGRPLLAQEILEQAGGLCPGIGAATVFRTLKHLLDSGQVSKVELPGLSPRYKAADGRHHHYFVCESCKQLLPVDGCVEGLSRLLPSGSRMKAHEIVIFGECGSCLRP